MRARLCVVFSVLLAAVATVVVAGPAYAGPGKASVDAAGVVSFVDTSGGVTLQVRNLTATTVELAVSGSVPPTAGPGCVQQPPGPNTASVVCTFGGRLPTVHIDLGDGDDLCDCLAPVVYTIDLGPGNDTLWDLSPAYPASVFGGDGDDVINTNESSDQIDGGAGFDVAGYRHQKAPVWASLAAGGGGMFPSEHDAYTGIEGLLG
ncbi:MAG TPA: hypothetical protein VFE14_08975, partial [Micromonosporaceae bacterium]|nr:hypothetical protein [Micromonosporaceae bacterium]